MEKMLMACVALLAVGCAMLPTGGVREIHVAATGNDSGTGSRGSPLRTIQAAANLAQPGDTVTVHEGVYRERVNPPRGGTSDAMRIVYRAAPGGEVVITGSEPVKGWVKEANDTWRVTVPDSLFGEFNPYRDVVKGDWCRNPAGYHTGAVYLDGHWLMEAASRDPVLAPAGDQALWFATHYDGPRVAAADFAAQHGVRAAGAEGEEGSGTCIGWIEDGDWARYDGVAFGDGAEVIDVRTSSLTGGGVMEIRLDAPDGELLGRVTVPGTGGWNAWTTHEVAITPTAGTRTVVIVFRAPEGSTDQYLMNLAWFRPMETGAEPVESTTTIWAQFPGVDPNEENVEINVRQTVFYPDQPGRNFITVRGFTMRHAATPWAPPTAEQIGLIGTHWSKGWIIENNRISHSISTGVTLGKHGDEFDNTSANSAGGYVKTVERAQAFDIPWTKEHIGHHIVRNNHISHCEQAGLVGSLGAIFSTITGNTIHDIHVRRMVAGEEMAGIKLHAAIDTVISNNHIFRTNRGIWLDWMAQGARVTGNLLHANASAEVHWPGNWEARVSGGEQDMFLEVNHGPILVDNNILLSPYSVNNRSQGVAFVHNLFAGVFRNVQHDARMTPFHKPHSTEVVALRNHPLGDTRFYNNIFVQHPDLSGFDVADSPVSMTGNVYMNGAKPSKHEADPLVLNAVDPALRIDRMDQDWILTFAGALAWREAAKTRMVTTESLGHALVPDQPFVNQDGSPYRLDRDFFGKQRNETNPFPGPFEIESDGRQRWKISP